MLDTRCEEQQFENTTLLFATSLHTLTYIQTSSQFNTDTKQNKELLHLRNSTQINCNAKCICEKLHNYMYDVKIFS